MSKTLSRYAIKYCMYTAALQCTCSALEGICCDVKVSWLVTPTPQAIGQLPIAIKPEPHLIHHVTVVHIGGTLYNILGELVKVTVFGPQAIVYQMNTDFWASQKTCLVSHKRTF